MENSNHEAMNKPVYGVEMFILKQLEAIQKKCESIMNCKYKNTTLEKIGTNSRAKPTRVESILIMYC